MKAHKWVAIVTYELSEAEAAAAFDPEGRVKLGLHNVADMSLGCIVCEQTYGQAKGTACPERPLVDLGPGGIPMRPS